MFHHQHLLFHMDNINGKFIHKFYDINNHCIQSNLHMFRHFLQFLPPNDKNFLCIDNKKNCIQNCKGQHKPFIAHLQRILLDILYLYSNFNNFGRNKDYWNHRTNSWSNYDMLYIKMDKSN